jgi:uncharacterized protein YndB with AHSA1/START domain
LTDVEMMRQWWGVHRGLVDGREGGVWALTWDVPAEGFGHVVLSGTIKSLRHGEQLHIENLLFFNKERMVLGPMTLDFDVSVSAGRSVVKVRQGGYGAGGDWDWYYQLVMENWPPALARLKEFLETAP